MISRVRNDRASSGARFRGALLGTALVFAALLLTSGAGARTSPQALPSGARILYASDWTGTMEIFAADPSGGVVGQLTFAHPEETCSSPVACGYERPQPSPDGQRLAYWSTGSSSDGRSTLWLAAADGTLARKIGDAFGAAWRPDSRVLAYSAPNGIHLLTVGGSDRIAAGPSGGALDWSPDGRTLAFTTYNALSLYRGGRVESLVPSSRGTDGILALAWSPDGRVIAYSTRSGVYAVRVGVAQSRARLLYGLSVTYPGCLSDAGSPEWELTFSPNGRYLAFSLDGSLGMFDTHGWRARTFRHAGHDVSWAPNGRSLIFVQGCTESNFYAMFGGDVQSMSLDGHVRTIISRSHAYGGQIVSAAWTTPPSSVRYPRAQPVTGTFAGGPVQKLATDTDRVAYASCGRINAWTVDTDASVTIEERAADLCFSAFTRPGHVGSLAIAGDRVLWWWADLGLGFDWTMREARIGAQPLDLAHGPGSLGATPGEGTGTAVGSGSLLAMSSWKLHYASDGEIAIDEQEIERVDPGGCPCPQISGSPGQYEPLDVDQDRIVVSGTNETRVLSGDGRVLLTVPVPTLAAQLDGSRLVLAAGDQLRVYDAGTAALLASWPMPASPVGHDCDSYADPRCNYRTSHITLEDADRGLATYIYAGQVHLLRLSDGADRVVAYGTLARFITSGLVYADGARIWLMAYDRLPLQPDS